MSQSSYLLLYSVAKTVNLVCNLNWIRLLDILNHIILETIVYPSPLAYLPTDFDTSRQVMSCRYRVLKKIGEGTFSQTVCAEDLYYPGRHLVAIKIMAVSYNAIGVQVSHKIYMLI